MTDTGDDLKEEIHVGVISVVCSWFVTRWSIMVKRQGEQSLLTHRRQEAEKAVGRDCLQ